MNDTLFQYLLRLGDDSLILGQRLTEYCGHAPSIEVDLSLANLALDLVGQATLFLNYAGEVEGKGRDGDKLAFHRDAEDFRNCLLVEQPNGDFAQTIARHFFFSNYAVLMFEGLMTSTDTRIAEIAAKTVKEMRYHAELSGDWVIRLGDGTEESHERMAEGLDWFWRFVDEMFDMDEMETVLARQGIAVDRSTLRAEFDKRITAVIEQATLEFQISEWSLRGGRAGKHSEHLSHMLAEMQVLPRAHPEAVW
mgnify:CR=1 FL=1|tara:strand:+ start:319 stop:1071 length:753 start_codon:yes stop_codon:yes gene_type:complete